MLLNVVGKLKQFIDILEGRSRGWGGEVKGLERGCGGEGVRGEVGTLRKSCFG